MRERGVQIEKRKGKETKLKENQARKREKTRKWTRNVKATD
jgi:hypothetical protein